MRPSGACRTPSPVTVPLKQSVEGPPPWSVCRARGAAADRNALATFAPTRHSRRHLGRQRIFGDPRATVRLRQAAPKIDHQLWARSDFEHASAQSGSAPFVRYNVDLLSGSERSHFGCTGRGSHFPNHIFRRCLCTKTASLELPTRRPLEEPLARGNIST